ncbi:MAG: Mur ligase family protein [Bacteroidales bacterium]
MNVHFIAVGGSAMHNLAIALARKGYRVTGSDDEIFEPSRTRLAKEGILPEKEGWYPERIGSDLDAVIVGMHARADNPELLRAKELGLKIYSFPEFLYEQSKNKKRVVIGGSHGKTTITSMILHVLKSNNLPADFMVGALLEGFDVMVKITEDAPVMILEGDEYLTSPLDPRPKFHVYRPDIALISGIEWDHINVFPTLDNYVEQFRIFAGLVPADGALVWCGDDPLVRKVAEGVRGKTTSVTYGVPDHMIEGGVTVLKTEYGKVPLKVFGRHNLLNIEGARKVCNLLGVDDESFYRSIKTFKGASRRLETIAESEHCRVFRDFAHAPSKLRATINAVRQQFPARKLVACIELHTYSSLNPEFIRHYAGTMDQADLPVVYFNPHTVALKKLPPLTPEIVKKAFGNPDLIVFDDSDALLAFLRRQKWQEANLLMMSSGDFNGTDLFALGKEITETLYE